MTFLKSTLEVKAVGGLTEQIGGEINLPDPPKEVAQAMLMSIDEIDEDDEEENKKNANSKRND